MRSFRRVAAAGLLVCCLAAVTVTTAFAGDWGGPLTPWCEIINETTKQCRQGKCSNWPWTSLKCHTPAKEDGFGFYTCCWDPAAAPPPVVEPTPQ